MAFFIPAFAKAEHHLFLLVLFTDKCIYVSFSKWLLLRSPKKIKKHLIFIEMKAVSLRDEKQPLKAVSF
ncbi:hypothetical protein [Nonlabens sp.]|uniref:hypothetical protein n=1 Tax=Nonlabens sp. TaxID=1888209 RepID=UPI00326475DA